MARYEKQYQLTRAATDAGGAAIAESLSNKLAAFSQAAGQFRQEIVVNKATQEGQKAGMQGAPDLKSGFTLSGQAYNKAATAAYTSTMDNDFRENVARIAQEHPDDLLKFEQKVAAYKSGIMQGVPEKMRPDLAQNLDNHISRAFVQVQGNTIARQKNEIAAQLQENANGIANESFRLARLGDAEGAFQELSKVFEVVDSMEIDDATKMEMKKAYRTEALEQQYKGTGDRLYEEGGIDAVNSWLSQNEGKPRDGLSPDEWDTITDAIQTDANRKYSRERAEKNVSIQEARESLRAYETAKSLGFEVNKADEMDLVSKIQGTPLMEQKKIIDEVSKFSVLPAAQRDAVVAEAQTGRLADVNRYAAMVKANAEINKMALQDGYTLGYKQGIVDYVPFDMTDPESFAARIDQAAILSDHYGVQVSPLAENEVQAITENLDSMTINEKIALAQTLNAAPAVWGQIDKNGAGTFAMAGASNDVNVMSGVFKGQELLNQKLVKPLSQQDYLAAFDEMTKGVYGTRDKRAVLDAALAHYAGTSSSAVNGIYKKSDFKDSVQAVTGGIGKVNGYLIELPRGVDEGDFEDFIDELQPQTIRMMGGVANYSDEEAVQAIQEGRIRNIGNNQYVVETNGGTLFTPQGKPFVFSYSLDLVSSNEAVASANRKRRSNRKRR